MSQCATGKNEVTLEFHQNDDTEVSLMEVRFYVPPSQTDERQDPVEVRLDGLVLKSPNTSALLIELNVCHFPAGVC